MADDPNQIAGAFIRITADFADLATSINEAVTQAQAGGERVATAFDMAMSQAAAGTEGLIVSVKAMNEAFTALSSNPAVADLDAELRALQATGLTAQESAVLLAQAYAQVGEAAGMAAPAIASMGAATQQMSLGFTQGLNDLGTQTSLFNTELQNISIVEGQLGVTGAAAWEAQAAAAGTATAATTTATAATEEATVSARGLYSQWILIGIAIGLFEKFAKTALESFGDIQRVTEALNATTRDFDGVANSMREIPALADSIGVSIQNVNDGFVKFARYGLDLKQIPEILNAIQSGAIAEGKSFETVASAWERAVNTGVLMSRSMQQMGINMNEVAKAMGMVGQPSTEITAAFKGIGDSLDGTTAATQRAAILMAAMPANLMNLATHVDDVNKSLVQAGNAWYEFKVRMGEALAQMGEGGGVTAFKVVLDSIATVILGVITVFDELAKTIDAVVNVLIDAFVSVGNAMADALTGNFKRAAADLQAGGQKMVKDWSTISGEMADEFTKTGKSMNEMWGDATKTAATSTAAIGTSATGMADKVAESGTAITHTTSTMVSNFQQVGTVANQALTNAIVAFDKAAAAFAIGVGSVTEYVKALKALDAAQKDTSGGFENMKTSMLIVGNAYRDMGVSAVNAHTTLNATVADMANGAANATQYTAALKALDKAQQDLNGGLQNLHTALLLVVDDHAQLVVTLKNAETVLTATYEAYLNNKASLGQLEAAINAVDKAQRALNDGTQSYSALLAKTSADYQNIQIAAKNAETALKAVNADYALGLATLPQLSAAVDAYVKAQTAASNGVESWGSAELKLLDSQKQLEIAYQNANTELAKATGLYNSGAIGLGVYEQAVRAAESAHDALLGVHKQQSEAVSQLTSALQAYIQAQNSANQSAENAMTAGYRLQTQQLDLQAALRDANAELQEATRLFNSGAIGSAVYERAIQAVRTALQNLGTTTSGMTDDMRAAIAELQAAASAMGQLGDSAVQAAGKIQTLGQELDQTMSAKIGNFSLGTMKPGDVITGSLPNLAVGLGGQNYESVYGTPAEIAARFAADAQALAASRQALQEIIDKAHGVTSGFGQVVSSSTTASVAISKLGVAAATALPDPNQLLLEFLKTLAANPDLTAAFQDLNNELMAARSLYDSGTISLATYLKTIDMANLAHDAWAKTMVSATEQVAVAAQVMTTSTDIFASAVSGVVAAITPAMSGFSSVTTTLVDLNGVLVDSLLIHSMLNAPGLSGGPSGFMSNTPINLRTGLPIPQVGTFQGAQGPLVNLTINIPGTIVGPGGIDGVTTAIRTQLVRQLATEGIRITRG